VPPTVDIMGQAAGTHFTKPVLLGYIMYFYDGLHIILCILVVGDFFDDNTNNAV
jgi:hypothetical protein